MTSRPGTATGRRDALAERLFGATIGGWDLIAVYLGDRLGYYRALAGREAATPAELAAATGTDERYTREWLEQQAVSGVLDVENPGTDAEDRRYALPPGHAEALTDRNSLAHVAPLARGFVAAAGRARDLVGVYRSGEGVSWEAYGDDMREAQGDTNRPLFLGPLGGGASPGHPRRPRAAPGRPARPGRRHRLRGGLVVDRHRAHLSEGLRGRARPRRPPSRRSSASTTSRGRSRSLRRCGAWPVSEARFSWSTSG
jgi:hypothetical protein